jgi:hypothetical protein
LIALYQMSASSSHVFAARTIQRSCFFTKKQRLLEGIDKSLYDDLSDYAVEFASAKVVQLARDRNLSCSSNRGRTLVVTFKDVIRHFRQITLVTKQNQEDLSYLFDGGWSKFWNIAEEKILMNRKGLKYEENENQSSAMKGDVAKLLMDKKNQCIKNLRKAVIKVHEALNVQVKSTEGKEHYKRGRKDLGLTFVHPVKKKVRKLYKLS